MKKQLRYRILLAVKFLMIYFILCVSISSCNRTMESGKNNDGGVTSTADDENVINTSINIADEDRIEYEMYHEFFGYNKYRDLPFAEADHYCDCEEEENEATRNLLKALCNTSEAVELEEIKKWIEQGADIDAFAWGEDGTPEGTPIMYAVARGETGIVEYLIKLGADLNKENYYFLTPLQVATVQGDLSMVRLLIENGAYVTLRNTDVGAILYQAVKYKRWEVMKYYLGLGLEINEDRFCLYHLVVRNNTEMLSSLLEYSMDINVMNVYPPLLAAIERNLWNMVRFMVENGSYIDYVDDNSETPLLKLAKQKQWDLVKLFIEKGADVNVYDNILSSRIRNTPLSLAVQDNNLEIVRLLLEHGADINFPLKTDKPFSILEYAFSKKNLELVRFLVDNGANLYFNNATYNIADRARRYLEVEDIIDYLDNLKEQAHSSLSKATS